MLDLTDTYTVLQAAKIVGLHPGTIRQLIRQKETGLPGINATKIGNAWFIRKGDLQAYMEKGRAAK